VPGRSEPIGLLALQGDYSAHARALAERGAATREVRTSSELAGLAGLVLPGGESTAMLTLMEGSDLAARLVAEIAGGLPVLATCAGVILLAREVRRPPQRSLGVFDAVVERNAYGRQLDSAVVALTVRDADGLGAGALEGVFIRAPRVTSVGDGVAVLATRGEDPVLLRQGSILAATFHPELTAGSPVVDLFVRLVRAAA
jgi:5'-phosphate synthase pdxT subunit